ncbi:hypothetical protein J6590_027681 [Homalodisca vitripennis]|nr:hypothetical protein J6590_027681 [Homalodisca vitripennis]
MCDIEYFNGEQEATQNTMPILIKRVSGKPKIKKNKEPRGPSLQRGLGEDTGLQIYDNEHLQRPVTKPIPLEPTRDKPRQPVKTSRKFLDINLSDVLEEGEAALYQSLQSKQAGGDTSLCLD